MKTALFAIALAIGGTAIAQTPPAAEQAPGNATPERDARGIPVVSAPASAPAGANQAVSVPAGAQVVPNPNQQQVFATQPAQGEMPPCSRTVTDRCTQTYERGRAPRS